MVVHYKHKGCFWGQCLCQAKAKSDLCQVKQGRVHVHSSIITGVDVRPVPFRFMLSKQTVIKVAPWLHLSYFTQFSVLNLPCVYCLYLAPDVERSKYKTLNKLAQSESVTQDICFYDNVIIAVKMQPMPQ